MTKNAFADKVGLLADGWAVRFNGMIESGRWNAKGPAETHLALLQEGHRKPSPEPRD